MQNGLFLGLGYGTPRKATARLVGELTFATQGVKAESGLNRGGKTQDQTLLGLGLLGVLQDPEGPMGRAYILGGAGIFRTERNELEVWNVVPGAPGAMDGVQRQTRTLASSTRLGWTVGLGWSMPPSWKRIGGELRYVVVNTPGLRSYYLPLTFTVGW